MNTAESTVPIAEVISHAVGVLFANYFGKAPVDVDTFIHGDLVVCRLHGLLTLGEAKRAVEQPDAVTELRDALHAQLAPAAAEAVGRITGAAVVSHMSAFDPRADEAIEAFVLDAEPSRTEAPL
jgi:uncharacterized protein YbcI